MQNPNAQPLATVVQKIWGATISVDADPALTVFKLPEAHAREVEELSRTLTRKSTETSAGAPITNSASATLVDPGARPGTATPGTAPGAQARVALNAHSGRSGGESVEGQDFFSLNRQLGKGGMGVVFGATQESLAREVAVKTLRGEDDCTPSRKAAFLREALTTGALSHPNIVPVHLFGHDHNGRLFLVMKRVEGKPWNTVLREAGAARLSFELASQLEILLKVCDAVGFAHARQIVHRDLKPENVIVGEYGEVTVMDWGLALDVSTEGRSGLCTQRERATVAGSPAYMAPEMALAQVERIGPATDIYLLGAILHEIVTGKPPHAGRTIFEVLEHAAAAKLEPIVPRPGLSKEVRELERMLRKAMAEDPGKRYGTVAELQTDLRAFMAGQGDRVESDALAKEAREALATLTLDAEKLWTATILYTRCAEILASAQRALILWGHNPRAVRVRQEALALYATLATRGKDWGLTESLLRDLRLSGSGGAALAQPVEQSLREARAAWVRRQSFFIRAYRLAAVMFFVSVGLSGFFYWKWSEIRIAWEVEQEKQQQAPKEPKPTPEPAAHTTLTAPAPQPPPSTGVVLLPPQTSKDPPPLPLPGPTNSGSSGFGPRAAPTWWIAPLAEGEKPAGPAQALPLEGLRLGPEGRMALWDRAGRAWLWKQGDAPPSVDATLFAESRRAAISCAMWVDGRTIALANAQGEVRVGDSPEHPWNTVLRCGKPIRALAAQKKEGKILLAAATDEGLWLASTEGGAPRTEVTEAPVLDLAFVLNGGMVLATRKHVEIWPAAGPHMKLTLGPSFSRAAIARQGQRIALLPADQPKQVMVLSLQTRKALTAEFPKGNATCLAISPDGQWVAAGSNQGELMLWQDDRKRFLTDRQIPVQEVKALEISANGATVYTLDPAGGVHAWDVTK